MAVSLSADLRESAPQPVDTAVRVHHSAAQCRVLSTEMPADLDVHTQCKPSNERVLRQLERKSASRASRASRAPLTASPAPKDALRLLERAGV